tara:strand:+ start:1145 stop:1753 length:609 start_codon:yes stop_codon:yes gene_type:complete
MSTLKVDTILKKAGTGTITLGQSGDTISIPSGATLDLSNATQTGVGTVSDVLWFACLNGNQSLSHEVMTKLEFDKEVYDIGSCYDPSTNYRMTVPSGKTGYYQIGAKICFEASANTKQMIAWLKFKLNGSDINVSGGGSNVFDHYNNGSASGHRNIMTSTSFILYLNAGDYVEVYGQQGHNDSSSANARNDYSAFWGHKIIT